MLASRLTIFLRCLPLLATLALAACQTAPPVQEMSDARQAITAARDAGAAEKATAEFGLAVEYLDAAEAALARKEYLRARHEATAAKNKALEALRRSETEAER